MTFLTTNLCLCTAEISGHQQNKACGSDTGGVRFWPQDIRGELCSGDAVACDTLDNLGTVQCPIGEDTGKRST